MEQLPVLVYGTLRKGQGNWSLLAGRVEQLQPATLADHAIYGTHRSFPYAAPKPGGIVVGELVRPRSNLYGEVLQDLDMLEGYHPPRFEHYVRTAVMVDVAGAGTCRAWVYLAGPDAAAQLDDRELIAGGDWLVRHRASA